MSMSKERFRIAAEALGKDSGLEVLYELHKRGRATASAIAEATGLHTATTMKYLGAMASAGLLETQTVQGKTREMVEYALPGHKIVLELDLSQETHGSPDPVPENLVDAMLEKISRIYGDVIDPPPSGDPYDLFLVLEKRYGKDDAEEIVRGAVNSMEKMNVAEHHSVIRFFPFISREVRA